MKKTIESLTPPSNKQVMWLDISSEVKQLKAYINGKWVVVNDDTKNNEEIVKKVLEKVDSTYYNALKTRPKGTFLAAPVDRDGKADFRSIAFEDLPDSIKDNMSYGVSWKPNVADPVVTRVGNMSYHKTLPIQNNMKGCIVQMKDGAKIMYFLDPTDWRWKDKVSIINSQKLNVTDNTYTITNDIFSTLQYENQWLRLIKKKGGILTSMSTPCKIISIDTSTKTATIIPEGISSDIPEGTPINTLAIHDNTLVAGTYDVELGAVLNGYDGEVMVLVPEFWIKSWDTDTRREVRISPSKIDDTWEHQPKILIGAYHDTVLRSVPQNMGYLSTLEVGAAVSIANINSYCTGGGEDDADTEIYKGMPRTGMTRPEIRNSCRKSGKELLSYLQYKRILYWLYVIEYANFNCQDDFNSKLTLEGFRQGGLGSGCTDWSKNAWIQEYGPTVMMYNGCTNEFGNITNYKLIKAKGFSKYTPSPRWHGIENPFGECWNVVDGVIIVPGASNSFLFKMYATDNPYFYSETNYNKMKLVGYGTMAAHGINLYQSFIKEWNLGNNADIIPKGSEYGGSATTYKCDGHVSDKGNGVQLLLFGGNAYMEGSAGLGAFASVDASKDNGAILQYGDFASYFRSVYEYREMN